MASAIVRSRCRLASAASSASLRAVMSWTDPWTRTIVPSAPRSASPTMFTQIVRWSSLRTSVSSSSNGTPSVMQRPTTARSWSRWPGAYLEIRSSSVAVPSSSTPRISVTSRETRPTPVATSSVNPPKRPTLPAIARIVCCSASRSRASLSSSTVRSDASRELWMAVASQPQAARASSATTRLATTAARGSAGPDGDTPAPTTVKTRPSAVTPTTVRRRSVRLDSRTSGR
jgi:hypothetical protein